MPLWNKVKLIALILTILTQLIFIPVPKAYAATTPDLGQAESFRILSSTYTNTVSGTTINGDLGYTTGPAVAPTVNGTTYTALTSKYTTAGTDQGAALAALASQPCTHNFPAGAVDLATDTSHGTIGVYEPGVYCTAAASAASIGAGGITLSGSGTYIFRIDGALTTVANSVVTLSNRAVSCDLFWTPTGATTLGANSTFAGTVIDDAGITIGSTVTWSGRALAFGGTVTTDTDTLFAPSCAAATSSNTSGGSSSSWSSSTETPVIVCPTISSQIIAPFLITSNRVDADSIFISWGPYSGTDTFNVRYGPTNGNWLYNTDVTGFSTTINALPLNQPIWVQVAARNFCRLGTYGESKLVGGPALPDTGFAPRQTNISWYLVGSLLTGLSTLLILIHSGLKFSSGGS